MMNLVIAILLLSAAEYSIGQRVYPNPSITPRQRYNYRYQIPTTCQGPDGSFVSIGSAYVKVKQLTGKNGRSLPAKYNCDCRRGGFSYCKAFDIPCADSEGNYADKGETFTTNVFGGNYTCICRGERGRFDSCVQPTSSVPDARCTDYVTGRRVQAGSRFMLQIGLECMCSRHGGYVRGSCRISAAPSPTPTGGCTEYTGRTVREGEQYEVLSRRTGSRYRCTCGHSGTLEPGSCQRITSGSRPTSRPTSRPSANRCGEDGCGTGGTCRYFRGRDVCVCSNGFQNVGGKCADIDECNQYRFYSGRSRCGENAVCVNTVGSYTCQCDEGFTGDGQSCSLLDQCTENLAQCDINARCISSATSFQCICNEGYTGDGKNCVETDVCVGQTDCDTNAECRATHQSYSCFCLDGYSGDGRTCRKMCWDEIANNYVERGEKFIRLSPTTGQQEGCTCGVGGVSVPFSCVGSETTTAESTTASFTTTAAATTARSSVTCSRGSMKRIGVGIPYERTFGRKTYICICMERRGHGVTRCRGAPAKQ